MLVSVANKLAPETFVGEKVTPTLLALVKRVAEIVVQPAHEVCHEHAGRAVHACNAVNNYNALFFLVSLHKPLHRLLGVLLDNWVVVLVLAVRELVVVQKLVRLCCCSSC